MDNAICAMIGQGKGLNLMWMVSLKLDLNYVFA